MTQENELKLCKFLLQKYADIINEREQRTIGEIKGLVDGTDLTIQSLIEDTKADTYEASLRNTYKFITDEINFIDVEMSLNYWMSAREIMEIKVADDEDLAVFLCAALKGLGDANAEVIIAELENLKTHAFVSTQIDNKFLILDPAQKHDFDKYYGDKTKILTTYSFHGNKIKRFLYRFNSDKYEQFLE
jgi:hypothetical protein